ncbi:MAG: NADH-quinone oxidoreductase subunit NuoG [Anaerolineales bacterium]|nr:NADH-quinone oxidoreductase subunit NuoG [Anaerolineales bacterium]
MSEAVKNETAEKMVTLTIDGVQAAVPEGTVVVDAAKKVGIDIPVFCYHPKMEPVGMCRMCLVEIGRPMRDRATGELMLEEDGSPKIQFGPKLETGCTVPVSEGIVVRGYTEKVEEARKEVLEFLLTSHPLDCPICDKGGECPLQNLTMEFGPGTSRYLYGEKKNLAKHVPLGDLIFLDRERCIQCARCTRFQDEVVDDPVIGFFNRGRSLEIVTFSDPGFDSYWSGNTTDICPVGALTTADFRFGARPWEMRSAASICNQCSVGCNTTFNVRREHKTGGDFVIKRVMPRQNEQVNEIWICDKGRFTYHFTENKERLTAPMVCKDNAWVEVSWEEAYDLVASKIKTARTDFVTLAGGRLSNEDYFNLHHMTDHQGGKSLLYSEMAGGDLVAQVGVGRGTNFSEMGAGTVILVVASDLEEEAPLYWLRVKQAAERGATLIVANPRATKLDRRADIKINYEYGNEAAVVLAMLNSVSPKRPDLPDAVSELTRVKAIKDAAKAFAEAENAVVLFGSEGIGLEASEILAQSCANLLVATGHIGRPNNGLLAVWDKGNAQGAWDMGFRPSPTLAADLAAEVVYVAGADPAGDDTDLEKALRKANFIVVQDLFLTETAKLADVILPAQAFTEREGTYTNAERRVQRFYSSIPAISGPKPDFGITAEIAERLPLALEKKIASRVMLRIAEWVAAYDGMSYQNLSQVEEQWPVIGRSDVYYGGTSYDNRQGLGVQLASGAERDELVPLNFVQPSESEKPASGLWAVPVTRLYDNGDLISMSKVLRPRLPEPFVVLHPKDAQTLDLEEGQQVRVRLEDDAARKVVVKFDQTIPEGVVLVPRSMGMAIRTPRAITIQP